MVELDMQLVVAPLGQGQWTQRRRGIMYTWYQEGLLLRSCVRTEDVK